MSAAVHRSTATLSVPQSQNTAPVIDFNCLYTHDVRKKSKKWQDGILRYHTFNKRAMVYDIPRNHIGDTHWTGEEAVQEGDQLSLEKHGVIVEVGDMIGTTETDLTELRSSTRRLPAANVASPAPIAPALVARAALRPSMAPRPNTQLKHRSLNALLGTPRGPLGKAQLPQKSPFEERQQEAENQEWEDGRPPKRPRVGNAPAWNVTRTTKASTATKPGESPLWARTADAAKQRKKSAEIIELSDSEEPQNHKKFLPGFSSDALAPSSSPVKAKENGVETQKKTQVRSSSPAFQTQQAQPRKARTAESETSKVLRKQDVSRPQTATTDQRKAKPPSKKDSKLPPPVSTSAIVDEAALRPSPVLRPPKPVKSRPNQPLRLASSAPRKKKTLLCQDQLQKKPSRLSSTNADDRSQSVDHGEDEVGKSARKKLQERLARIEKKNGSTSMARLNASKKKRKPLEIDSDKTLSGEGSVVGDDHERQVCRSRTTHEASAVELARLDSLMLPPVVRPTVIRDPSPEPADVPLEPVDQETPHPPLRPPPRKEQRPLRRVFSETAAAPSTKPRRMPGAPVRYTPTPSPMKESRESTPASSRPGSPSKSGSPAKLPQKYIPPPSKGYKLRKPLQKSVSLNMTSSGTSAVLLRKPFQAPGKSALPVEAQLPKAVGPWSREAFDLFEWRPSNWDEEKWCKKDVDVANEAEVGSGTEQALSAPPAGLSGGVSVPDAL